jgi:hypothetical protein
VNAITASLQPLGAPASTTPGAVTSPDSRADAATPLTPAMQVAFASLLSRAMGSGGSNGNASACTPADLTGAYESLCEALAAAVGAAPPAGAKPVGDVATAIPVMPTVGTRTSAPLAAQIDTPTFAGTTPVPTPATDAIRALIARVAAPPTSVPDGAGDADHAGHRRADRSRALHDAPPSPSASVSLATQRSAAQVDPTLVVRDMTALQPDFRAKLDRVVSRMKDEYGHDVTVAETWRSQSRQDFLHEQGRSRSGPVVTWTRQSQHTDGRAADLVVDGKWASGQGYADLMRVAQEEGLQTLGARDPGHVALAGAPTAASKLLATIADTATIADVGTTPTAIVPGAASIGTDGSAVATAVRAAPRVTVAAPMNPGVPAEIARVAAPATAEVAPLAHLANVATVAVPGDAASHRSGGGDDRRRPSDRTVREGGATGTRTRPAADTDRNALDGRPLTTGTAGATRHVDGSSILDTVRATDATSRAEQVLALQDAKDAQPMSHMLLRLDNGDGGEDRIRVDVRGATVGATIDVRDPDAAAQLAARIPDLTSALQSRGLAADALRVRAASATGLISTTDIARATAAAGEPARLWRNGLTADAASPSSNSRHGSSDQRSQQDPSRHRSRKEQQGEQP